MVAPRPDGNGPLRHQAHQSPSVVLGIILGLGFGFMIEGAKVMSQNWWVGGIALLGTLLTNRIVPAMFLLLLFGASYGILKIRRFSQRCARCTWTWNCAFQRSLWAR
jgi:hypothetical protein